jgi:hypothetical protein
VNYLYLGLADLYLPAAAAGIHLGRLDSTKPPAAADLLTLPHFRRASRDEDGRLFPVGSDYAGNMVYLLCVRVHPEVVVRSVESLLGLYGLPLHAAKVVPCLPENPQAPLWGRVLSGLGLHGLEQKFACLLVRNCFGNMLRTVAEARVVFDSAAHI